ncbi:MULTISPECIES: glycosyltransferase family 2 protein [unclassified Cyanobium]|uniref:glycosyltransferase family 2 protein n=1 Tax=unclassified Cyanobium TaxID=2627006 RepID=UPI0020CCA03F|nr:MULTISPECIES: hypothetical protein [unclassified Cyanobium]MCP9834881.1 hypothetical protein [Cyanobium sp. La Preciosa 7G6]MCP9937644.1 hypothetical protein [Cyanobium sp. Aljojuca 7A6]
MSRLEQTRFARNYLTCLERRDLAAARSLLFLWIKTYFSTLPAAPSRCDLTNPDLWGCLAQYASLSGDLSPVEDFWQRLDGVSPHSRRPTAIPLLGIPILNRPDLLLRLLESLDHPVETLAIVDNSIASGLPDTDALSRLLAQLEREPPAGIGRVRVARPFANQGVASSWNAILTSFPEAPFALLVNNDVAFAPGVLAQVIERIEPSRPQFLPLLPAPQEFSAFAITPAAWNRVGLFDANFHPAYCEDLDYAERLRACEAIAWITPDDLQSVQLRANPTASATIASDPRLEACNRTTFLLNSLWLHSQRRLEQPHRGSWIRRWLSQWDLDSAPPQAAEAPVEAVLP